MRRLKLDGKHRLGDSREGRDWMGLARKRVGAGKDMEILELGQ